MKVGLFKYIFIPLIILSLITVPLSQSFAQEAELRLTESERAALEAELKRLEAEMAQKQAELKSQQQHSGTLTGDIKVLTAKINAKVAEIRLKNRKISSLSGSISEKKNTIVSLAEKIEKQKQSLAQLIRKTNEMDQATLTNFFLSSQSLSDFYSNRGHYSKLKEEIKLSVDEIKQIKGVTEQTKSELEKQQRAEIDQKKALQSVQQSIQSDKNKQQQLLTVSKNKEAEYAKIIAEQEKRVGEIRARLFNLAGGSKAIRFDEALGYAQKASSYTGVEPALILAIATQESNLGANVGQCYLHDPDTGATKGKNTGRIFSNGMKPTRDVKPFLEITAALGYNAYQTVVSCPIAGIAGWGGAMGPSQFIPSTWQLVSKELSKALGVKTPNPWNAEHAFMASAMYLRDLGGVGASYSAQKTAACRYYGGGAACRSVTSSYGKSVMALKAQIQADIDYLNEYGVSRR